MVKAISSCDAAGGSSCCWASLCVIEWCITGPDRAPPGPALKIDAYSMARRQPYVEAGLWAGADRLATRLLLDGCPVCREDEARVRVWRRGPRPSFLRENPIQSKR